MPPPSVVSSAVLAAAKLANAGTFRQLTFCSPASLGGQVGFGPWNFYYGDWAEVIVFNRILSVSERALVVNYLNGRYGLGAK